MSKSEPVVFGPYDKAQALAMQILAISRLVEHAGWGDVVPGVVVDEKDPVRAAGAIGHLSLLLMDAIDQLDAQTGLRVVA